MNYLRFDAVHIEASEQEEVLVLGASTSETAPEHYLLVQVNRRHGSLSTVYLEVDDQVGGQYGVLASMALEENLWVSELLTPPSNYPSLNRVEVRLKKSHLPDFGISLEKFLLAAKVPEGNGA